MSIRAKAGSPKELIEADGHIARCILIVHIGTVEDEFKGEKKLLDKIIVTWELPNYTKEFKEGEGEKPFVISKKYTLSMYEKANLRKDVEGWRGKGFTNAEAEAFDIAVLIEQPCMLNIIQKPKQNGDLTNAITSISKIPKAMGVCPPIINVPMEFNFDDGFDLIWLEKQPDWLKGMIMSTPEYKGRVDDLESDEQSKKVEAPNYDNVQHGVGEADIPTPNDDLPF